MNILDQIIEHKRREVDERLRTVPISALEKGALFSAAPFSLKGSLRDPKKSGIIAEFKRRSPSKGVINDKVSPASVTAGYAKAGASALSVLTDQKFFGGSIEDLYQARKANTIPILRKDFTIHEYQIVEAKSFGADAILLIAAVLTPDASRRFSALAHSLGMEVLLEVHNAAELQANLEAGADLIGVNNRNLKDFVVSIEISRQLAELITGDVAKVSESGISTPEAIADLKKYGYEGFLIGENFMKQENPEMAAAEFITKLKGLKV